MLRVLLAALLLAACQRVPVARSQTMAGTRAEQAMQDAFTCLKGEKKDLARARKLLLAAVEDEGKGLPRTRLCYAYCYLGYIEDREEHRDAAIGWFRKALDVKEADPGILQVASVGLSTPIKWIRHLDEGSGASGTPPPVARPVELKRIGAARIFSAPPPGLKAAASLTAEERRANFDALWRALDETYAGFELKRIDWKDVRRRYLQRLDSVTDTQDFYRFLFQLVSELRDTHSWLQDYPVRRQFYGPAIRLEWLDGKPMVVAGAAEVPAGAELLEVDGRTVDATVELLRPLLPGRSSERAFRSDARHYLLSGDRDSTVSARFRLPDGAIRTFDLKRDTMLNPYSQHRDTPVALAKGRFVDYGLHASGAAYIRIRSFSGREEIADEFDRALDAIFDAPGLLIDIRGNPGGFGNAHARIVGRFATAQREAMVGVMKNGPGHSEFTQRRVSMGPIGNRQYTRPVLLLTDVETGSAADLFAVMLRNAAPVVQAGATTHGNLSGTALFIVLPCDLAIRVSNAYITDPAGHPIESGGNVPDVPLSPTLAELLSGKDGVLERAVRIVLDQRAPFEAARARLRARQ